MATSGKSKKRCLPAWMKTVHNERLNNVESDVNSNTKCSKMESKKGASEGNSHSLPSSSSGVSASDVIADTMPLVAFPGNVVYCNNFPDCACYCEELLLSVRDAGTKMPVGFDMEWPVSYAKGLSNKTALIQMCFSEEKCYLFHVSAIGKFPSPLRHLILDEHLILVGLNIETDLWKLEKDFDICVKPLMDRGSVIDVAKLANKKLKSSERWDLNGLCKNVLRQRLNKDNNIRCGPWTEVPLSQTQQDYAVCDAYAGLKLYQSLISESLSSNTG